ncbi:monooxygenase [Amnibacterium flavum]|uniref:Monooxygenase n=2 Tax=Amnibacterium flavum TaxID=2173173 RepID=A0A2V1HZF1_9MICO|nr:monooxygenase [Amnibacterium flavum]
MTASTLARRGLGVTVVERSGDTGRTGAALSVPEGLLERITGLRSEQLPRTLAPGVQSWFAVHTALHAAAAADLGIHFRENTRVVEVGQDTDAAWAVTAEGERIHADILVGADGHRSVTRRHVAPDKSDARYAGQVLWIGVAEESAIGSRGWPASVAFQHGAGYTLIGYPLPGADGSTAPGARRLGWALYDSSRDDVLRGSGALVGSVVQHTLTAPEIPEHTFEELARDARRAFSGTWRDAMVDSIRRRAVIGTPVAEYVPDRLVRGRVALVGDAAHVANPMTGRGFAESLLDAESLGAALSSNPGRGDRTRALLHYELDRLDAVREFVRSGR